MARHIYYACVRCHAIHCMICEAAAPNGYSGKIKTAVKWCTRDECVADEATNNGVKLEEWRRHKRRVQEAWRRDGKCSV